jgi:hypothetical protein
MKKVYTPRTDKIYAGINLNSNKVVAEPYKIMTNKVLLTYICMDVCVYVYMYVFICLYLSICIYICGYEFKFK